MSLELDACPASLLSGPRRLGDEVEVFCYCLPEDSRDGHERLLPLDRPDSRQMNHVFPDRDGSPVERGKANTSRP